MRDDIVQLIDLESELLKDKLQLIHKLLLSESEKIFFIKSGNHDRSVQIFSQSKEITDEIDAIDFKISSTEQTLSRKTGVPCHTLFEHFSTARHPSVTRVLDLKKQVHGALRELLIKSEESTSLFEQASEDLKKDIGEINDIIRLIKKQNMV